MACANLFALSAAPLLSSRRSIYRAIIRVTSVILIQVFILVRDFRHRGATSRRFSRRSLLSFHASSRSLFISSDASPTPLFVSSPLPTLSISSSPFSCASLVTSSGFLNLGDRAICLKVVSVLLNLVFPGPERSRLRRAECDVRLGGARGVVCKNSILRFSFSTTSGITRMHTCPTTFSRASSHIAIRFPGIFPLFSTWS